MIKETRQYFCDACGKETTVDHYSAGIDILEVDDEGYVELRGYDFCKDCMRSFIEWKKERKAKCDFGIKI